MILANCAKNQAQNAAMNTVLSPRTSRKAGRPSERVSSGDGPGGRWRADVMPGRGEREQKHPCLPNRLTTSVSITSTANPTSSPHHYLLGSCHQRLLFLLLLVDSQCYLDSSTSWSSPPKFAALLGPLCRHGHARGQSPLHLLLPLRVAAYQSLEIAAGRGRKRERERDNAGGVGSSFSTTTATSTCSPCCCWWRWWWWWF